MEWQPKLPTSSRKRPSAARHEFRARQSQSPAPISVSHAEASGSSRMLTGTVGGDNVHGNVTHIANYYASDGTSDDRHPRNPDTHHNLSSVLSDSEKEELFKRLHFPQLDARLTNLGRAGRRTCEWLLRRKDYREWMDIDSKHPQAQDGLFWIRGKPGTGKSIAMKFLFQKMQSKVKRSRDGLVLSFFFNARGSDLEKSTLGLYRSLLFGLLSSDPSLLEVFDHCSRSQCLSVLSGEWEHKHERLLQELLENTVNLLVERKTKLYCYVDALDECPENQIRDMVTYFEDVMTEGKSRSIRVCFSSRHYPRITIKTKRTMTLEHEASHNDDIRTYIASELRLDEHTDQIEVDRLRDVIVQKSVGIFLWVSLAVRQLNDVFDNDGRMETIWQRLEEIPRAAKETPLSRGDLPLYGLFQDVIRKDTRNIPNLVRLTQLIFCAKRPLRPQEAFVALHQSYHERFDAEKVDATILSKQILAVSKGLAEVTRAKEPTVQFIHETVREFLRDGGLAFISKKPTHGDGNEVLKNSCLEQIKALDSVAEHSELLADYRTWTRYRDTQDKNIGASQREEFQKQISQIFPFLGYATQYVLFHANAAAAEGLQQRPFLNSFPSHLWVSLHNLFQKANTKRFSGSDTPIIYILAGHGLNDLVRILRDPRNYATTYQNEQCPTALHNAIYSGNLDTARVLVGLSPKERSLNTEEPRSNFSDRHKSLLTAILYADDVDIFRKVIRDHDVAILQEKRHDLVFGDCRSAAMLDCLAEHLMLPGIMFADEITQHNADVDKNISATSDLPFIRRAIDEHPNILTDAVWNNKHMLDYAIEMRFFPLVALYLELKNLQGQATLNDFLERGAMAGFLAAVKEAQFRGADLSYEDESGQTVLHKMVIQGCFYGISRKERTASMCSVLQYLLESPKLEAAVDRDGYTAFDLIRNSLWRSEYYNSQSPILVEALKTFVKARATTNTGFVCKDHQYPWVVVPWVSIRFSMQLTGESQTPNLNARDSLGRTALSWCFWNRPGVMEDASGGHMFYRSAQQKGLDLLEYSQVDVNSRDNSGQTILEHLIRHPSPHEYIRSLTANFFNSRALDVNLETSNGRSPLDLIVSLYGTWPAEFDDIQEEWWVPFKGMIKGREKQLWVSEGLVKTARLLLETRKVHLSEQKRCLAKAPDDLRSLLSKSIIEAEPHYLWQ